MLKSIVEYCSEHEGYRCGYCGSTNSNFSHGIWAHSLTVEDYQDLIDRGWRRSGKYCYKPTMDIICCPMYTIRCRALEFKASKSQKKVLKRFNKYLSGDETLISQDKSRKMSTCSSSGEAQGDTEEGIVQFVESTISPQDIDVDEILTSEKEVEGNSVDLGEKSNAKTEDENNSSSNPPNVEKKILPKEKTTSQDPNRPPCVKAKLLRKERRLEKLKAKGIDVVAPAASTQDKEKNIEDLINELPEEFKKKLEIKLVRTHPPSPEYFATSVATHRVYVKYQTTVHNDKPEKCTDAKFEEFLVHSPLLESHPEGGPPSGYGSFHQQYWLCGKLIAVGVIDILPKCVSSVYFFYDPQYMNLTLGTYGAIREIEFTRQLQARCPDIKYYYMGFYVHMCKKMRYKGNFSPSDLLCPETYKWFPIKDCIPKLEVSPYCRLDPDIDSVDEKYPKDREINNITCWVRGTLMPYKVYKKKSKLLTNDDDIVKYSELVGGKTIQEMILIRPRINF